MNRITTPVLYKRQMGLAVERGDGVAEARLQSVIDAVCNQIAAHLNRTFDKAVYCEWIDGHGHDWVILRHYPVNRVLAVSVDNHNGIIEVSRSDGKTAHVSVESDRVHTAVETDGSLVETDILFTDSKTAGAVATALIAAGFGATVMAGYSDTMADTLRPVTFTLFSADERETIYCPDRTRVRARLAYDSERTIVREDPGFEFGGAVGFPCGRRNIFIRYDAGYTMPVDNSAGNGMATAGNVPEGLTLIANMIVKAAMETATQNIGAANSESLPDYSYSVSPETRAIVDLMIRQHAQALMPYRNMV